MGLGPRRLARFALAVALLGALLGALPAPAVSAATTYTVNALTDTGAGSGTTGDLRYAITQVNAGGGSGDTITITATGTIHLGSTLPTLSKTVTIAGPGAGLLTIDGGCTTCDPGGTFTDGVPVFVIGNTSATIGGLTIQHGNAGGLFGGAIDLETGGTVTVRDAAIARNHATFGGAIYSYISTVIVDRDTFEGNTGDKAGGAINNNAFGTLTVTNSTFANNRSRGGGAISNFGQASVAATTISGNGATASGGGIDSIGGPNINATLAVADSIVAGNSSPNGPDVNTNAPVTDGGYNVIGSPSGNAFVDGANHDHVGTAAAPLDAKLAPLGGYGSADGTQTFALLPGSPALDIIPSGALGCGTTLATDQRGIARPQPAGGACDSGSFESRGFTLAVVGGSPQSAAAGTAFANPLALAVAANSPVEPVQGGTVTFAPPASGASATVASNPATIGTGGVASATATATGTTGTYAVTANTSGAATSATFTLTNIVPTITLAPTTLPDGAVGIAYPATTITASGGAALYTFAVTAGALPAGLRLTTMGTLSGTPISVGTRSFTITATDANGFKGMQAYIIVVVPPSAHPAPEPASRPGGGDVLPLPAPAPPSR